MIDCQMSEFHPLEAELGSLQAAGRVVDGLHSGAGQIAVQCCRKVAVGFAVSVLT
jgi:hypothetical protein